MSTRTDLFRERAMRLRKIAECTIDKNSRGLLLDVAKDYERMARTTCEFEEQHIQEELPNFM